jgi:hypothetical protein
MKNFLIAVVIAVIIVNCIGSALSGLLDVHLYQAGAHLASWESMALLSVIGVVMVVVGFIVALSVVGTILLAVGAAFFALLAVGVGAFWPIIVVALLIYALRHKSQRTTTVDHGV